MHSLRTRMPVERVGSGHRRYISLTIDLPPAFFPARALVGKNIYEEASMTEAFANVATAVVPASVPVSPARVLAYREDGQRIVIDVATPAAALLVVNQTYFSAWDTKFETVPADVDRLGVIVPAGTHRVELRFGRRHAAVAIAWIASSLLLLVCLVQVRDRRAGEVERSGHENRSLG
jgi:hypothetical protein